MCTRLARWVRRRDRAGRVLVVANQKPGTAERYGLTRGELDRAAWTVDADGRKLAGAAAANRVLRELGGGWPAIAVLYGLQPIASLEQAMYGWFARNRSRLARFGVTPECDEPGSGCA